MELILCLRLSGMRIVLIFLLFFFTACIPNKHPNVTYSFSSGVTWQSFKFNVDSTFTWKEGSCTHHGEISGNYTIVNRKLTLFADTLKPAPVPSRIHHTEPVGDSCLLSFTVFERLDTIYPIPFTLFNLSSETDTSWKKQLVANIDGVVSLHVHKYLFPIKIQTRYLGYGQNNFVLDRPVNTADSIFLAGSGEQLLFLYPIFPQEYRILRMNRRKLHLVRTSAQIIPGCGNAHTRSIRLRRSKKY
ncbi:MAG: hypothetical protein IM638_17520 [Bacteroidetes bacterium]|nr:hypothetical protein [Bacteroidota bacterium]